MQQSVTLVKLSSVLLRGVKQLSEISGSLGNNCSKFSIELSEIDPKVSYAAQGLDSVDIISLFGEVEGWLGVSVDPESMSLWDVETLQDIADILYKVWQDPSQVESKDDYDETEGFI